MDDRIITIKIVFQTTRNTVSKLLFVSKVASGPIGSDLIKILFFKLSMLINNNILAAKITNEI